jgi:hypothetical protein
LAGNTGKLYTVMSPVWMAVYSKLIDPVPSHMTVMSYSSDLLPAAQQNPIFSNSSTVTPTHVPSFPKTSNAFILPSVSTGTPVNPMDGLSSAAQLAVQQWYLDGVVPSLKAGVKRWNATQGQGDIARRTELLAMTEDELEKEFLALPKPERRAMGRRRETDWYEQVRGYLLDNFPENTPIVQKYVPTRADLAPALVAQIVDYTIMYALSDQQAIELL